jgi:hypothetical protein
MKKNLFFLNYPIDDNVHKTKIELRWVMSECAIYMQRFFDKLTVKPFNLQ